MKKNYKIISIFFIVSSLIFTFSSCSIANPNTAGNVSDATKTAAVETTSSFDLTEELNTLKGKFVNPPVVTSHKPYQEMSSNSDKELVIIKGKSDIGTSIALKINGILIDKKYAVGSSGDKIVVHFHFAPADSLGYFFTDDIVSTHDIFITSSGK